MILFIPTEGLANRIRTIDSMIQLCEKIRLKYRIYWRKDAGLNCAFSKIWKPLPNLKEDFDVRYLNILFIYRRKYAFVRKILLLLEKCRLLKVISDEEFQYYYDIGYDFKDLQKYCLCMIKSFSVIKSNSLQLPQNLNYKRFVLADDLKGKIAFYTKDFPENIVGIHIRRTDNKQAIAGSPLAIFESLMEKLTKEDPGLHLYLATDDIEVRNRMKEKFGEKIIVPQGALNRDSEEGILQSTIEMYSLAKTKKIYGSYFSSYSETAALLGNLEYEIVR